MIAEKKTIFCDIDGTIFKQKKDNLSEKGTELIKSTYDYLVKEYRSGNIIVLTTERPYRYQSMTERQLREHNVPYSQIVMGLGTGDSILVNDSLDKNKAYSINVKTDEGI